MKQKFNLSNIDIDHLIKNNISIDLNLLDGNKKLWVIQRVVNTKGYIKVREGNDKGIIDLTTANTILNLYENLGNKNQLKFIRMLGKNRFPLFVDFCYKLLNKCEVA